MTWTPSPVCCRIVFNPRDDLLLLQTDWVSSTHCHPHDLIWIVCRLSCWYTGPFDNVEPFILPVAFITSLQCGFKSQQTTGDSDKSFSVTPFWMDALVNLWSWLTDNWGLWLRLEGGGAAHFGLMCLSFLSARSRHRGFGSPDGILEGLRSHTHRKVSLVLCWSNSVNPSVYFRIFLMHQKNLGF